MLFILVSTAAGFNGFRDGTIVTLARSLVRLVAAEFRVDLLQDDFSEQGTEELCDDNGESFSRLRDFRGPASSSEEPESGEDFCTVES